MKVPTAALVGKILGAIVVALFSGCSSTRMATPEMRTQALEMTAEPGVASVYVFRGTAIVGGAGLWKTYLTDVTFDEAVAGASLGNNSYALWRLMPGRYKFAYGDSAEHEIAGGEVYFFSSSYSPISGLRHRPMKRTDAEALVTKYSLVESPQLSLDEQTKYRQRETNFKTLRKGMSLPQVEELLGRPMPFQILQQINKNIVVQPDVRFETLFRGFFEREKFESITVGPADRKQTLMLYNVLGRGLQQLVFNEGLLTMWGPLTSGDE